MQKEFSNVSDEEIAGFYSRISHKIRNLRKSKDVSQLDLALEIKPNFYSNRKNNRYDKH